MEQKLIAAQKMAEAVQFDPQFTLPTYPRFLNELVTIPLEDGLLVDGTNELQVLRGRAAQVLLPRLLPLLDGTRTIQQVTDELANVPVKAIYNAVSLLYTRGVLEDNTFGSEIDTDRYNPQTLTFFRRYIDATRVNRSALQAQERLQHKEVLIYTFGSDTQETHKFLSSLLYEAGVNCRSIEYCEDFNGEFNEHFRIEPEFLSKNPHDTFIVVFTEGIHNHSWLQSLDDKCAEVGISWLLATLYSNLQQLELGPYFERGETACYRCFARAQQEKQKVAATNAHSLSHWQQTRSALNFLATEIIYLLSRIAPPATGTSVMQYDLENWSTQRWRFPRLPGCMCCLPLHITEEQADNETELGLIDTAFVYEEAVAFPSRHLLDPKSHQLHYRLDNIELTYEGKHYIGAPHITLPDPHEAFLLAGTTLACLSSSIPFIPTAPLDKNRLATLLLLSAGIRSNEPNKLQRWASTGGNLGSVELYLIALHVDSLEPGIYFYEASGHRLACVKCQNESEEIVHFMQQAISVSTQPDALIIATAAFHRVSHKYGAFGYRICYLDAGFALGQISIAGHGLGLNTHVISNWADDVIAQQLDLEHMQEMVTAVVAISGISSLSV